MSPCSAGNEIRSIEGPCEERTPNTNRLCHRGVIQPRLLYFLFTDLWHSKRIFGGEERDQANVSELLYSGGSLSTPGRKEAI